MVKSFSPPLLFFFFFGGGGSSRDFPYQTGAVGRYAIGTSSYIGGEIKFTLHSYLCLVC